MMTSLRSILALDKEEDDVGDRLVELTKSPPIRLGRNNLWNLVNKYAKCLAGIGVKRGDVVAIVLPNSIEFVFSFIAIIFIRAIAAPLNPSYTSSEFDFYLRDANVSLLICPTNGNDVAYGSAQKLDIRTIKVITISSIDSTLVTYSNDQVPSIDIPLDPSPSDPCLILHTSGTTSKPKAVQLTHQNLVSSIGNISNCYLFSPKDTTLLVMPLFHVHGLICALLTSIAVGAKIVIPQNGKFSASTFWRDCIEERVTWYTAVPTIHQVLLLRAATDYPKDNPHLLRFIRSASSPLSISTMSQLESTFHAPVLEAYAMTEASHQMTSNPLPQHGDRRPGTVGKPTGIEVTIRDTDNQKVEDTTNGQVCIRGPNVSDGYLNNPEANLIAFEGGWFHTGDQGFMSADGYLTLTGRLKELINRGGEKISPVEIDEAMMKCPEVLEATSFAAPDEKYGEVVNVAVVLKEGSKATEDDLKSFIGGRLSAFKVPHRIFLAQSVPKTATGKIQRRLVAEHFLKSS